VKFSSEVENWRALAASYRNYVLQHPFDIACEIRDLKMA
jgi:hypothetical protein